MGSFANTLFSLLFGWVRTLAASIWNAATLQKGETFLQWIGKHWIVLTIVLCATGLAVDFCIYLTRGKPYRVWGSFFRRLRKNEALPDEISAVMPVYHDLEASGAVDNDVEELRNQEAEEIAGGAYQENNEDYAFSSRERLEKAIKPARRRNRLTHLFNDEDETYYDAPQSLIDRNNAYHRPVYPQRWNDGDGTE